MPMGNVWAFPSHTMNYETTLGAMKALAARICKITADSRSPVIPSISIGLSKPSTSRRLRKFRPNYISISPFRSSALW